MPFSAPTKPESDVRLLILAAAQAAKPLSIGVRLAFDVVQREVPGASAADMRRAVEWLEDQRVITISGDSSNRLITLRKEAQEP